MIRNGARSRFSDWVEAPAFRPGNRDALKSRGFSPGNSEPLPQAASQWAIAAILLVTLAVSITPASAQDRWTKVAPFPDPTPELIGAEVNGKMYVFGGLLGRDVKGVVYEYDPAADRWTRKKDMPLPAHHVMAAGYRGKVYLFGGGGRTAPGGGDWLPLNNSWEYDPVADTWKALAPMPTARGAGVAVEVGGKIYVMGGASVHPGAKIESLGFGSPHRSVDTNEAYDPATNTWQARSPMPTGRNHLAGGAVNGKIYVIGGRVGSVFVNASSTDLVEQYDPATDSWGFAGARMPFPRSGVAGGAYGGKVYVAGGEYLNAQIVGAFRDFDAYDPAKNSWESLAPIPVPLNAPACVVIGNRLYLVSGQMQSGSIGGRALASDATWVYELGDK